MQLSTECQKVMWLEKASIFVFLIFLEANSELLWENCMLQLQPPCLQKQVAYIAHSIYVICWANSNFEVSPMHSAVLHQMQIPFYICLAVFYCANTLSIMQAALHVTGVQLHMLLKLLCGEHENLRPNIWYVQTAESDTWQLQCILLSKT